MTVLEAIQKGADFLARKGVESPRLNAELLLAHRLNLERLRLYLNFERHLTEAESGDYRELLTRRGQREPVQYLTGSTSFCGVFIEVSAAALVPRPETEVLAEKAWEFLNGRGAAGFLEIGAGTGCISIAIAAHAKNARGVAIEISSAAIELARSNIERHAAPVELRQGNLFEPVCPGESFDAIVSNPPYIPSAQIGALPPEVRDFEPREALDGGADGLDFFREFAEKSAAFLKPGGRLFLEFSDGQAPALVDLFTRSGWPDPEIVRDLSGRERVLVVTSAQ